MKTHKSRRWGSRVLRGPTPSDLSEAGRSDVNSLDPPRPYQPLWRHAKHTDNSPHAYLQSTKTACTQRWRGTLSPRAPVHMHRINKQKSGSDVNPSFPPPETSRLLSLSHVPHTPSAQRVPPQIRKRGINKYKKYGPPQKKEERNQCCIPPPF